MRYMRKPTWLQHNGQAQGNGLRRLQEGGNGENMYKITFVNKKDMFEKIVLEYERWTDASNTIECVFAGDMNNAYQCTIEIVDEENSNDVD